jgi:predicted negative regulator of RcsB-dependent stress response
MSRPVFARLPRHRATSLLGAAAFAAALSFSSGLALGDDNLRPEIGKHLQQAQDLASKGKAREALAQVAEADAVSGKSAFESFTIERMRGSVAAAAGDNATAAKAFEAVVAANKLPPAEQLKTIEALGGTYYRLKDYSKSATWVARYIKEGGTDGAMKALLAQDYYLAGDYSAAAKQLQSEAAAEEAAGKVPAEDRLQMLLACQKSLKDSAGYVHTMEILVSHYPKKEYWSEFVHRVETRAGFADRLQIDLYRFKNAHGFVTQEPQVMEMAQLALQAGFPSMGKKVMDQGFQSGLLGKGPQADREKRLLALVEEKLKEAQTEAPKTLAEARDNRDGTALINLGIQVADSGDGKQGISLAEEGMKKGNFRHPDDAKLRLAELYIDQKQDGKAATLLKSVGGADGAADVAHLWLLQTRAAGH